jgi:two-component system CheB/CheR fusion protein
MNKPPRKTTKKKSPSANADTTLQRADAPAADLPQPETSVPFQIVGIGSSAGGIEALTQLFSALDAKTGMAFVVVQHLDPTHESMIVDIIGRTTALKTVMVEDNIPVEPDHIYVIPPGKGMVFGAGKLQLSVRTEVRGQHRPIDQFLRSLAQEHGDRSIAVILSGMGSDGTLGLEEIKGAGGITFAQDYTAEHPSMPRSAIATGCIDMVLAPIDIARELARIAKHPLLSASDTAPPPTAQQSFDRVIDNLRDTVGVDFSHYKRNTLHRRIMRRMVLHRYEDLQQYAEYLQSHPNEAEALYEDILINVTSFFRDPEAYELLKTRVFSDLTGDRSRHEPVRVWVLGCSTGEEAYSIAMAYTEFTESSGRRVPMQIFATDLNASIIDRARTGIYAKGIEQDVSPERLRRFFTEVDGTYRIAKPIRDMCVFARQNALSDPPFSRMDLVACRNMLIYMEPVLQQRLIPVLHYALRNRGFLWLGTSETIGAYRDLFELQDAKYKLYMKKPAATRVQSHLAFERPNLMTTAPRAKIAVPRETGMADMHNREADRILLARYAPPAVIVTRDLEILHYRGDTGPYLAPASGRASLNLLKMLRDGLVPAINRGVQKALRDQKPVREDGLRVRTDGAYRDVDVEIVPIHGSGQEDTLLLLFHDKNGQTAPAAPPPPSKGDGAEPHEEIERLRQELSATRDYLQSVIEQQDAANEELQSANEEVQSANEELQSTNEELETSKEEIQSSNEELETVNDELHSRNLELSQSNNDLLNLLSSAHMPIVILGRDLVIRRLTPAAEKMLNLIPADVGRPISDIKLSVHIENLEHMLLEVIDTVSVREREVQDAQGRYFLVRVRPYKTVENKIDGAVLIFIDIDSARRAEEAIRESEARFSLLANSAPVLIWVSGPEGLEYANRAMTEFFGASEEEIRRYDWARFIHPEDRAAYVAGYVERFTRREPYEAQLRLRRADGEYRWMKSIALPRHTPTEFLGYVACCFDISDLKLAETALHDADNIKNRFIAVLGHELRNPLAAVRNSVEAINLSKHEANVLQRALEVINRQTVNMVRIVDDLLDISRITHGMLTLHKSRIDVVSAVRQAVDATEHLRKSAGQSMHTQLPDQAIFVEADAVRLEQIFGNLLVNASKFTNAGGNIRVRVEAMDGATPPSVSIRVVDDGIGMSPSLIGRIFELFVQGEMSSSSRATGMGLGLPLSKQLVELHGGSVRANSDGEGKGLEIEIRLPTVP